MEQNRTFQDSFWLCQLNLVLIYPKLTFAVPRFPAIHAARRTRPFINGCHKDHSVISSKSRIFCCCMNLEPCYGCVVLSGYWVGPDLDDGWGYVEAFVNRIYWVSFWGLNHFMVDSLLFPVYSFTALMGHHVQIESKNCWRVDREAKQW